MSPRRPPRAVVLVTLVVVACAYVGGTDGPSETDPEPIQAVDVAAAPPLVAAVPPVPDAKRTPVPAPQVVLPEITALALARQVLAAKAWRLTEAQQEQVARVLADAEQELDLEVLLVLALIMQESRFDPHAVGPAGSMGLMQIRPWVGEDIAGRYGLHWPGPEALYDPAFNVRLGTWYFAEMMGMFGDPQLALAAYNMGPYRVRRLLREGFDLQPAYVDRVFEHYDGLYDRFRRAETGWGG